MKNFLKSVNWEIYLCLAALVSRILRDLSIFAVFYLCPFNWSMIFVSTACFLLMVPIAAILLIAMTTIRVRRLSLAQWGLRFMLLICLIGSFCFQSAATFKRLADIGTRKRVSSIIDLNRVQAWAVKVIREHREDSPPLSDWSKKDPQQRYSKEVPPEIIKLEPDMWFSERDGNEKCLWIGWGSGFHHWAVVVGSPAFKMERDQSLLDIDDRDLITRWQDGIYGYQER